MKKTSLTILGITLCLLLQAQVSKTLIVTAGRLGAAISIGERSTITDLTISGTIDARDLYFMHDSLPKLKNLDISNTTIPAFTGILYSEGSQEAVDLPANYIPGNSFSNCDSLYTIKLPPTLELIGDGAFEACDNLRYIDIPDAVYYIGEDAFYGCSKIQHIILPSSLYYIGDNAFIQTDDMQYMVIKTANPANLGIVGSSLFNLEEINDAVLYVPAGSKSYYETGEWEWFGTIIEGAGPTAVKNILNKNVYININSQTGDINVNGIEGKANLTLMDLNGKLILAKNLDGEETVSVSSLPQGIYVAKVTTEKGSATKKIMKK